MSNILKGILNESNPFYGHNDPAKEYGAEDPPRFNKSRSSYRSQEDDTSDADIAYSKKMYQLGQQQKAAKEKAQRDSDHDRLATGTNEEDDNIQPRMRMNDYYELADALQEKLRQAIKLGNTKLVHELSKERDDLDARVKQYGLMPESEQLDELDTKLGLYKIAAGKDATAADKAGDYKRGHKRFKGIMKATEKEFANDARKKKDADEKKSAISQGINEFAPIKPPTAGAFGGNKDYGQPTSSRYLGNNKFVLGTTNNYVLTATVDKWGLEWDEDDEIWFLDSPGAVYIADATEGEIELPAPQEQRNQIHDLVSDYLNERNSADLQKVAAYFGHSPDGEMATNEAVSEAPRFNSKQEVINHFVKNGKSAAAGAAAWERGYRGSSKKPIELKKPPQKSYHDELDDKRYDTFENLGDQLKSKSLEALTLLKQQIEQKRAEDLAQWEQDFRNNVANKMRSQPIRSPEATPVAQPGEKHSALKARLSQLNSAIEKQALLDKLVDKLERKGLMTPAMQNDIDTRMHVKYGAKDNYQSLNKKLDNAIAMLQDRLYIRKKSGLKEVHDERDEYDNPRQGRDYGKGNLFVDPGSNEFKKEVHPSDPNVERGRPKNLKGVSKALPADAFGRTTGKIPDSARPTSKEDPFKDVDEGWSQKYKSSINCSHPKGFSQKAHCAGKKKHNESIDNVMEMTCPDCGMCETHSDHENLDEACWKGYHKEGNKKMFGKTYPNCVKNKKTNEDVMGSLNELSVDLLQKAAQVAKDKREQAMNPVVHNALGGGYMNPLAKHYDAVNQKLSNRAVKVGIRDKVSKIASPALMRKMELEDIAEDNARVARKPGQPANSKKHSDLYTDENPKGTITGLKFATAEDARASVGKIRNSGRSHAHKIQAAVAMEQRAKAAGKAEAASVYRKYINSTKKTEAVAEGAEIMYAEELAEKVFDQSPNLQNENDILTRGFQLAKKDPRIGGRVNAIFRTEDFPSDFVSYYRYIQHNHGIKSGVEEDLAEGELDEACWDTHKQVGMKKKGGKMVPKCVAKEDIEEQHSESCPHCGGKMVSEELMNEIKDACYSKVKSRYKVWPSAYASGALVKCRKVGAANWGNGGKKNESSILEGINRADESLHDWFNKEKWVRMDTKGKIKGPCAREPGEGKPKCLPQSKAHSLGKKGRASAAKRKRREDPNPERSGKAINVDTKKK